MREELKLYHSILPIILIPICLLILVTYGWTGYATLTEKSGLNGSYYLYYNLSMVQFYIYEFIVAFIALALIVAQISYSIRKSPRHLTITFCSFAVFIALVIICEIYLESRFTGKG
ncbi:hypothetical protein CLV42_11658 [Chitinophaga ginsengisoli]|uniref:Uncharacterized protein n=1 Tax=Chitinophaga ginsengisoli TaxID=363837 RepID=A0A2P8FQR8_9BACT|nr:hypothetical protein CLV42_11658 [Chitinophaga ginsengisoli]